MSESDKEDITCGINKLKKNQRRGTIKECAEKRQIRFFGLNKVDPEIIKFAKIPKGNRKYNLDDLYIKLVTLRGRMKRIKKDQDNNKNNPTLLEKLNNEALMTQNEFLKLSALIKKLEHERDERENIIENEIIEKSTPKEDKLILDISKNVKKEFQKYNIDQILSKAELSRAQIDLTTNVFNDLIKNTRFYKKNISNKQENKLISNISKNINKEFIKHHLDQILSKAELAKNQIDLTNQIYNNLIKDKKFTKKKVAKKKVTKTKNNNKNLKINTNKIFTDLHTGTKSDFIDLLNKSKKFADNDYLIIQDNIQLIEDNHAQDINAAKLSEEEKEQLEEEDRAKIDEYDDYLQLINIRDNDIIRILQELRENYITKKSIKKLIDSNANYNNNYIIPNIDKYEDERDLGSLKGKEKIKYINDQKKYNYYYDEYLRSTAIFNILEDIY